MNEVGIAVQGVQPPAWLEEARAFALRVLEAEGKDGWDLSILVCDDALIRGLNLEYRDRDEATDVLSFEQGISYRGAGGSERFLAGDIVISLGGLARNVEGFTVSEGEEYRRLIVHGVLHLSGLDHATNEATEPMLMRQEEILLSLCARGKP